MLISVKHKLISCVVFLALFLAELHADETSAVVEVVRTAPSEPIDLLDIFRRSHDGWSLDELMIRDDLRTALMTQYAAAGGTDMEEKVLEDLIKLRKSGRLNVPSTRRQSINYEALEPAAEIAARRMFDIYAQSLDRIFVDPKMLAQFDILAQEIVPAAKKYDLRKAALHLRKSRQLMPELLARVTDWKVEIEAMNLATAIAGADKISVRPGIYIFRDATGYLYIGQSKNLRERLTKHLQGSDRMALANYLNVYLSSEQAANLTLELHVFLEGSPAEQTIVREAYESELIRIRKPRLNLSP